MDSGTESDSPRRSWAVPYRCHRTTFERLEQKGSVHSSSSLQESTCLDEARRSVRNESSRGSTSTSNTRGEKTEQTGRKMDRKRKNLSTTVTTISASKKRKQSCPINGCDHSTNKLKWHVYYHLPHCWRISKTTEPHQDKFRKLRAVGLVFLSKALVGRTASVQDLVQYTNEHWQACDGTISAEIEAEMELLLIQENWPRVANFTLRPVNSPAVLIHWRPLSFLLNQLDEGQREEFLNLPIDYGQTPGPQESLDLPLPFEGFDSHFHLDRLEDSLGREGLECILETPGREPEHPVVLAGGVLNYCDPENHHRVLLSADQHWKVAVGIHPKKVSRVTDQQWDRLQQLLAHPRVVAISEVGLDFSISRRTWDEQVRFLERLVNIGTLGYVLVLHLRGARTDPTGIQVQNRCREVILRKCSKYQRIHLHSFSGDIQQMEAWSAAFPNCFFSFSAITKNFSWTQQEALRSIPLSRILLETDSPHLRVHSTARVNTPAFLGDVGNVVAQMKNIPTLDVMQATTRNAMELYGR